MTIILLYAQNYYLLINLVTLRLLQTAGLVADRTNIDI